MEAALAWYEERSEEAAERFRIAVRNSLDEIETHPIRYAVVFDNVRRVKLPRFPYVVLYRGDGDEIEILGILHAASDPKKWRRRAR